MFQIPKGIILITPESLEAMFVTKPYNVTHLFSNLKFVIIDEIHSFIGTDRGIQLKSILSRLQERNRESFKVIGLSATIGDYEEAKRFTGDEVNTKVLLDKGAKQMSTEFRYFPGETDDLPLGLLKDMYMHVYNNKTLIFPNSRGRVEEIAVNLKKISKRVGGHENFFTHHSSVDKEEREYVDFFAKNSSRENFSISCTSTLELGIDIGSVDQVVQVDATHSVSSLIQRVGRSGRKDDAYSKLALYATNPWSMLQSLACWNLHNQGFIEPPDVIEKPYDILGHQALSIIKGHSGIDHKILIGRLSSNSAFQNIPPAEIAEIIDHFIHIDLIEKLDNELIIGIEGEKIVNNKDFYSVFQPNTDFKVIFNNRNIGELPPMAQAVPDNNILLAAKIWKVVEVDQKARKIYVMPAKDGKKPKYLNSVSGYVHPAIHWEMFRILMSNEAFDILDDNSKEVLKELRKVFHKTPVNDISAERPVITNAMKTKIYIFWGTKTTGTLAYMMDKINIGAEIVDYGCALEIATLDKSTLFAKWQSMLSLKSDIDQMLHKTIEGSPQLINICKYGKYLPNKYQVSVIKQKLYDFDGAFDYLQNTQLLFQN